MALSRVHESADGGEVAVGDDVEIVGTRPREDAAEA